MNRLIWLTRVPRPIFLGAAAATAMLAVRRRALRGGATDDEVAVTLPGDHLIETPSIQTTHATTIHAPPAVVWRWLIQCGFRGAGRAGWYSDSWLDWLAEATLFRITVPKGGLPQQRAVRSAEHLLAGIVEPTPGDVIPDGPPGTAVFVVKEVVKERAWVLYSDTHIPLLSPLFLRGTQHAASGDFTWVFILQPTPSGGTRVLLRTRARYGPTWFRAVGPPILFAGEAVVPGAILRGLKRRAEAPQPPRPEA